MPETSPRLWLRAESTLPVLDNEPPHFDNPLLAAPRCYITPHVAWSSAEARERLLGIAIENIKAYLGGKPINIVR